MYIHLHIIYDCLPAITAELRSCVKDPYSPQSLKYLLSGPLQEKFANPCHNPFTLFKFSVLIQTLVMRVKFRAKHMCNL